MVSGLLVAVFVAAFSFEFINGFHDTANAIATTVYTRALPVRAAILMSATMNFVGALKRTMASTGYSEVKDLQRAQVVVSPYSAS